jgi:hypothetical protein
MVQYPPGLPEAWLTREDRVCREGRLERLRWLTDLYPPVQWQVFSGGHISLYLFEEARYCFIYGQFLAAIMLGLAFVERVYASEMYASGKDGLARAGLHRLLSELLACGYICTEQFNALERARRNRNTVAHFREPLHKEGLIRRSVESDQHPYSLIEEDARNVLRVIMELVGSWSFSA